MNIVVDTSVLIDHLKGKEAARRLFAARPGLRGSDHLFASVLTRVEIRAGMRRGEEGPVERLFGLITWVGVDEALADRAGSLAAVYLRSHPGVDPTDYVIAATAQQLDAELWTLNRKHFPMFPDLVDPYKLVS